MGFGICKKQNDGARVKTIAQNRFLWAGLAGAFCFVLSFALVRFVLTLVNRHSIATADHAAVEAPAKTAKVFLVGALSCEGSAHPIAASAWRVTGLVKELAITDGSPPFVEVPLALLRTTPVSLTFVVPGWNPKTVTLPAWSGNERPEIQEPIQLSRERAAFALAMPSVGTDYDLAEFTWLRPLEEEPLAVPLGGPVSIPLDFSEIKRLAPLPTGLYRCTLKGRGGAHIRNFDVRPSVALRMAADPSNANIVSLPPTLSRTYIGFAGSAADPDRSGGSIGFFCGVRLDLRKNFGEVLLAFRPLESDQTLRYTDLKPRPDTVWPTSNLFLQDPVSLSFDCPLSYADHRLMLQAADGRFTLLPELVLPEDAQQRLALLDRLRALIRTQARRAAAKPGDFDPRYAQLPLEQLPNYENLLSPNHFARHLERISRTRMTTTELGSQITVRQAGAGSWKAHVDSIVWNSTTP